MRRWSDFFAMVRHARRHAASIMAPMRPYYDHTRQMVGLMCTETGEVWQIDVMTMRETLAQFPEIRIMMDEYEGREAFARAISDGFQTTSRPGFLEALASLARELG